MTYTPETLRKTAEDLDLRFSPDRIRAAADAWEADQKAQYNEGYEAGALTMSGQYHDEVEDWMQAYYERDRAYNVLAKRLEAAEAVVSEGAWLWPWVFGVMPKKGRFRQQAERFYDALRAAHSAPAGEGSVK